MWWVLYIETKQKKDKTKNKNKNPYLAIFAYMVTPPRTEWIFKNLHALCWLSNQEIISCIDCPIKDIIT